MTSESPDTERDLPEIAPQRFAGPFIFSIVLHGAILMLFARSVFSLTSDDTVADERPSIRVALTTRARPAPPAPPTPEVVEEVLPEPTEPEPAEIVDAPPPAQPAPEPNAPEPTAPPAQQDLRELTGEDTTEDEAIAEADADAAAWTPARIRAAIEDSTSELRRDVTEQWMSDCIVERKQSGARDCEQQSAEQDYDSPDMAAARAAGTATFAGVTRANRKWIVEDQFRRQHDALRNLMDEEGVLGEVAAARYYINRDNISYLSGYFGDYVMDAMGNFSADVLGGMPMIVGGSGGNSGFNCAELITTKSGRKVKVPAPCVYEYTGFEIERPEEKPDPNAFRVVPQVFGTNR